MYALVITFMILGYASGNGFATVKEIDGFRSESLCETAKEAYLNANDTKPAGIRTAICVRKSY